MCNSLRVKIFDRFEDLKDYKFGVKFIKSLIVHIKDKIVQVTTAEKRFENDY
jgi:hypothetical protein